MSSILTLLLWQIFITKNAAVYASLYPRRLAKVAVFVVFIPLIAITSLMWAGLWIVGVGRAMNLFR
ncbi:hypothetical protein IVA96_15575 [Bradyrhizobium sp. 159]|uniref:hypothetical protein n=1 Tax=Bradyrhizobium sp. 159 TaxID=2782632 RepID=UPI001FFB3D68|nr:hypothetical protein [Bradyrhizobium sp. 159]MCK1618038.1 hypothetical protein [Bradyrhizobium sp. 159]